MPTPAGAQPVALLRQLRRADYRHWHTITTRWMDIDVYGHVNNVHYYSYFDTAVNQYLIGAGALDPQHGAVIGLVVETACNYFQPLAFPDSVTAGIRVTRIGHSSVRYEVGLFRGDEDRVCAAGHFVHVLVDRASRRPVGLPAALRQAVDALMVAVPPP